MSELADSQTTPLFVKLTTNFHDSTMKRRKARLIIEKKRQRGEYLFEMVAWEVPVSADFPHGIKYRLWFGRNHQTVVLYDVHPGKLYHKHIEGREFSYEFQDLKSLIRDFMADTTRYL